MNPCITVTATPVGDIYCTATAVDGIKAYAIPIGGISCKVYYTCSVDIGGKPYLEIEPEIIWVLAGWSSNDVYSNTTWHVD